MKWISVKDKLPTENQYYIVISHEQCDHCDANIDHAHRLNFKRFIYDIAYWSRPDQKLVDLYHEQGNDSWDWAAKSHWSECNLTDDKITHWMKFPNQPERSKRENS